MIRDAQQLYCTCPHNMMHALTGLEYPGRGREGRREGGKEGGKVGMREEGRKGGGGMEGAKREGGRLQAV